MRNKAWRQIIHELTRVFVWAYIKPKFRYRTTKDSDKLPPPPYLVVSNHGTFFDPWLIGVSSITPFAYMCNDDAFRASPFVKWYLNMIGAFPKKKGAADYKAMKETLRRLKDKTPVCIFPEGQTTWDGRTQLIYKGLEKVVRKAGVPLVIFRLCGNFLVQPWWARTARKGKVWVTIKVLGVEQIAKMSDDELFGAMKAGIAHDEIHDERNQGVFRGKELALGLERFVWSCPDCRAEDRLETRGNSISCNACGAQWEIDALCRFTRSKGSGQTPADLTVWADMQIARVRETIEQAVENAVLTISKGVVVQKLAADGYSFDTLGQGILELRASSLRFEIESGTTEFAFSDCGDFVIQKKDIFECRAQNTIYRFVFDHHSPMKWVWYCRFLSGYADALERGWL